MDYKTKMDSTKICFTDIYENALKKVFSDSQILDDKLLNTLKEKRDFGLQKYGNYSFQSSFEKAMSSPVEEHLIEELIDACNYSAHVVFQAKVTGNEELENKYQSILTRLYDIYNVASKVE